MLKALLGLFFVSAAWGQAPVQPLIIGADGISSELDGLTQYLNAKGYCFENSCSGKIDIQGGKLGYTDPAETFTAFDDVADAAFAARYTLTLQHNGTVGNGTFFGYSNLLPGDATPVLAPINSVFKGFTFSNANSGADYTLEFRKNSTTGTVFYTISKVNTQFFTQDVPDESFNAGDAIYVKYVDDGNNASDAGIVLYYQVIP